MATKTYAEKINSTSIMISGLRANMERSQKRGLGNDFINELETILNEVKILNNEQEALKAKLKTKTDELNKKMDQMNGKNDEGKKVVKLEFDKSQWKEFGIDDKR